MPLTINHTGLRKLLVNSSDTSSGRYLLDKFTAGSNVTFTVLNPGANEQIQISSSGSAQFAQVVYLDKNASGLSTSGLSAFATFQGAYNAANTAQVGLGGTNVVAIVVGTGSATDFGNLVLTAAYNPYVILVGEGMSVSVVGNITGNFDTVISAYDVTVGNITQSGKIIHISGLNSSWGNLDTSKTGGTGGVVTVDTSLACGTINTTGDTGGQVILATHVSTGTITTDGQNTGGEIDVGSYCTTGKLSARGLAAGSTGGFIDVANDVTISGFATAVNSSGALNGGRILFGSRCSMNGMNCSGTTGSGGIFQVGNFCSTGAINSSGGTASGSIIVGDYCSSSTITANGGTSTNSVSVGNYCTLSSISSSATTGNSGAVVVGNFTSLTNGILHTAVAGNSGNITAGNEVTIPGGIDNHCLTTGGTVTLGNDCKVSSSFDTHATDAGGTGGSVVTGDRCVLPDITSTGGSTGGSITIGNFCTFGAINCSSTNAAGGNVVIGAYSRGSSTLDCSGATTNGSVSVGAYTAISGNFTAHSGSSDGQNITFGLGCSLGAIGASNLGSGGTGSLIFGAYTQTGSVSHVSGGSFTGNVTVGDGSSIGGSINNGANNVSGNITLGTGVTVSGSILNSGNSGNSGTFTCGRGCNVGDLTLYGGGVPTVGAVTVGASSIVGNIFSGSSRNGATVGDVTIGEGATIGYIDVHTGGSGATVSGNVTLKAGASSDYIRVDVASGTPGAVILQRSNKCSAITLGTVGTAVLKAQHSQITGQIDRLSNTSILSNCNLSTPSGNQDCIAEVSSDGVQLTGCVIVPNGTGKPITASSGRTVRAYNNIFKTAEGSNITLNGANNYVDSAITLP